MTEPNYTMLRLMIIEAHRVRLRDPSMERMPTGAICPGYDIELMQTLAVLKYVCGIKTQWSCQGNHKQQKTTPAYILLPPGESFPEDLIQLIENAGLAHYTVPDYDSKFGGYTGKTRFNIRSCNIPNLSCIKPSKLMELNEKFLSVINNWAREKIIEHLPKMSDPYYEDIISIYKAA